TRSARAIVSRTLPSRSAAFISLLCPFIGAAIRGAMRQGQGKSRGQIPRLWLMTDERIGEAALLRAVARLPRGAAVVVRHYRLDAAARRALFGAVRRIARRRGLVLLLAGPPAQARCWGAQGHHGRDRAPPRPA